MAIQENITVRPGQLLEILRVAIRERRRVLIVGSPGIGKTDIVDQASKAENCSLLTTHLVTADPTEAAGLPWPNAEKNEAYFMLFGNLATVCNARTPMVWFLDDFGQASPAVQASFMRPLLDYHTVSGYEIPKCVSIIAATNKRTDRAGVSGVLEPVKSRFDTIIELQPTLDDWAEWAIDHKIAPEVLAFIRFRPALLHKFEATADLTNSPCPRTWAKVSHWLSCGLSRNVEYAVIAGAVGAGAAIEFTGFLKICRELPDPDQLLLNPDTAAIPTEPASLYALTGALAARSTKKTFAAIATYATRMLEGGHAEFGVLLIKDAYLHDKTVYSTPAFTKLTHHSKLGGVVWGNEQGKS